MRTSRQRRLCKRLNYSCLTAEAKISRYAVRLGVKMCNLMAVPPRDMWSEGCSQQSALPSRSELRIDRPESRFLGADVHLEYLV